MENRNTSFLQDISVPVYDLRLGMFVSNLDCGWARTPFLLEGLLLKNPEDVELIKSVARYVTVDLVRGEDFALKDYIEKNIAPKRELGEIEANTFATSSGTSLEDFEPLTYDFDSGATESGLDANLRTKNLKGQVHALKSWVSSTLLTKAGKEERTEFPRNLRPAYLPPDIKLSPYSESEFSWPTVKFAQGVAKETIAVLEEVTGTISRHRTLDAKKIHRAAETLAEHIIVFPDAMIWVSRLRQKDDQLLQRSLQAGIYLTALGRYLGFPRPSLTELATIGLLLDLGKTQLDSKILSKPARLSAMEFQAARRHVELGMTLLRNGGNFSQPILRAIAEHHEQMNGEGYPNGLTGPEISLFGKMAAIADGYVAMVNPRPYAAVMAPHEAIKQLFAGANTRWFGPLVEQFVQAIGIYPVGSLVELATGHIAIVVQHNPERRLEPKLLIVTHGDKRRRTPPLQMNLLQHNSRQKDSRLYIKHGLPDGAYGIDVQEFYAKR